MRNDACSCTMHHIPPLLWKLLGFERKLSNLLFLYVVPVNHTIHSLTLKKPHRVSSHITAIHNTHYIIDKIYVHSVLWRLLTNNECILTACSLWYKHQCKLKRAIYHSFIVKEKNYCSLCIVGNATKNPL